MRNCRRIWLLGSSGSVQNAKLSSNVASRKLRKRTECVPEWVCFAFGPKSNDLDKIYTQIDDGKNLVDFTISQTTRKLRETISLQEVHGRARFKKYETVVNFGFPKTPGVSEMRNCRQLWLRGSSGSVQNAKLSSTLPSRKLRKRPECENVVNFAFPATPESNNMCSEVGFALLSVQKAII